VALVIEMSVSVMVAVVLLVLCEVPLRVVVMVLLLEEALVRVLSMHSTHPKQASHSHLVCQSLEFEWHMPLH
jgi:hypothetical protein